MTDEKPSPEVPFTTPSMQAIEAEIAVLRRELAGTVDDLTARLAPRAQAEAAGAAARRIAADATSPDASPQDRAHARRVLIGTAVATAFVVTVVAVRIARRAH